MNNDLNWEWYRTFLKVLETGSLSAAGRALGMTQPTVGRHIDSLEIALGLKLFTRSYDGYAPTDAASELATYAQSMEKSAAALRRAATGHGTGIQGTVRISASEMIAVEVLPPILAQLRAQYPALRLELVASNKTDDLLHREADIAVRMFRPVQNALVVQRVGAIEVGLFAHSDYLRSHGIPTSVEELSQHALIGFDQDIPFLRHIEAHFPWFSRDALAFRTDSDLAQWAAIRSGLGVGLCQVALADKHPNLVRVLPSHVAVVMDTWVAMHEDLRSTARFASTFESLFHGLKDYASRQATQASR